MGGVESPALPIMTLEGAIAFAVLALSIYSEARLAQPFHLNLFALLFVAFRSSCLDETQRSKRPS